MSEDTFLLALKSTIDKAGYDLGQAEATPLEFIDLDNVVNTEKLLETDNDALVWELIEFAAKPRDPLYGCHFNIGARTVNDPANYNILGLVGKLKVRFNVDSTIDIHDYSGATAGPKVGVLRVWSAEVMTQQYDKVSGIRMVSLHARVQRLG